MSSLIDGFSNMIQWLGESALGQFAAGENLLQLAPEFILLLIISFGLFQTMSGTLRGQQATWHWAVGGVIIALGALVGMFMSTFKGITDGSVQFVDSTTGQLGPHLSVFYDMFRADPFSYAMRFFLLLGTLLVLLFSRGYMESHSKVPGELYVLILGATLGAMLMTGANDLIMVFVALETLGISSFILAGYLRGNQKSAEASLKYLIFGGSATAVLLFGFSLLYGLTGGYTDFSNIANGFANVDFSEANILVFTLMFIMITGGFAFKLSAAPFHMWTPDIYEGAPTPVTAYLSVVSKLGAFAMIIRFLFVALNIAPVDQTSALFMIFAVLAVLSMTLGNVVALRQGNIKRMLAYSTIAHVGYILLGFAIMGVDAVASMVFYLMTYVFMNLGAFAVAIQFGEDTGRDDINAYAGLVRKRPFLSLYMTFFMLSLAGIPITAGFFAKFFLFEAVAAAGNVYLWFVVIALLNSTISLYYYLNVVRLMLVAEPSDAVDGLSRRIEFASAFPVTVALVICFLGTLLLGFYAEPLMKVSREAVSLLRPDKPLPTAVLYLK